MSYSTVAQTIDSSTKEFEDELIAPIIALIYSEKIDGKVFCETVRSIEDLQKQFGVKIPFCDRALLREKLGLN